MTISGYFSFLALAGESLQDIFHLAGSWWEKKVRMEQEEEASVVLDDVGGSKGAVDLYEDLEDPFFPVEQDVNSVQVRCWLGCGLE